MRSVITRAFSGVLGLVDSPTRDGRFLLASQADLLPRTNPLPLYVGHGNPCEHVCLHYVGAATDVWLHGPEIRASGWINVQDGVFDTVPAEMFVGLDVQMDRERWRLRSAMLHMDPHLAAWPEAKIRHFPHPDGPVLKVPEEPVHGPPQPGWPPEGEGWMRGGYWH